MTEFEQLTGDRPVALTLTETQLTTLFTHLQAVWPEEGCGLLAGEAGVVRQVIPVENRLHSQTRFAMAARPMVAGLVHILEAGWQLSAVYHSHPAGPARLSTTDLAELTYPNAAQLVVSLDRPEAPVMAAYWVNNDEISEVPLQIV